MENQDFCVEGKNIQNFMFLEFRALRDLEHRGGCRDRVGCEVL